MGNPTIFPISTMKLKAPVWTLTAVHLVLLRNHEGWKYPSVRFDTWEILTAEQLHVFRVALCTARARFISGRRPWLKRRDAYAAVQGRDTQAGFQ